MLEHRLVHIPRPILRIPMLAIHLQRDLSTAGFNPNKQTQCTPLFSLAAPPAAPAKDAAAAAGGASGSAAAEADGGAGARHHALLLSLLAKELGCAAGDIVDFELSVVDTQPGTLGGALGGAMGA